MRNSPQWLLLIAGVPALIFLMLPLMIVVPMAFTKSQLLEFPPDLWSVKPFQDFFNDRLWTQSVIVSIKVAAVAMILSCVTGTLTALALHRSKLPGRGLIGAIALLPAGIPVVVLALGDYLFFARIGLGGEWLAIGLAHSVLVTPFVFIAVQTSLVGLNPALARAARSLGAGNLSVFRHVYWPAILPGVAAGAIFSFIGSFDEVVIAIFLSGPESVTLPVRMFTAIEFELTPKIAAVSSLLLLLSVVALLSQGLGGRLGFNKIG